MKDYIWDRVRADAAYVLDTARVEGRLPHTVVRGRMRELLVDKFIAPWLPQTCRTGTGTIIDLDGRARPHTQDDVVIYDHSIMPAVLADPAAKDGVFPFNSVLMRLEVKSTVNVQGVRDFVDASRDLAQLRLVRRADGPAITGAVNMLFAFGSDLKEGNDLDRLLRIMRDAGVDPTGGVVSGLCVANHGFWKLHPASDGKPQWMKARRRRDALDDLVVFLGCVSNTCYVLRAQRQGRSPNNGCESGIGDYLPADFDEVPCGA